MTTKRADPDAAGVYVMPDLEAIERAERALYGEDDPDAEPDWS